VEDELHSIEPSATEMTRKWRVKVTSKTDNLNPNLAIYSQMFVEPRRNKNRFVPSPSRTIHERVRGAAKSTLRIKGEVENDDKARAAKDDCNGDKMTWEKAIGEFVQDLCTGRLEVE
jgi:hypothetical protein